MADEGSNEATSPSKTGYTPGEDGFTRWRNFFSLISGQMTYEGKLQYRADAEQRHEKTHCQQCEKHRDYLLKYSALLLLHRDRPFLTRWQVLSSVS